MNASIRAVVRTASALGIKVIGVEGGFTGLIRGKYKEMGNRDVGNILQRGGTILQTARCEEFRTPAGRREALREMNNAGIEALVVIGGDGSLNGAQKLAELNFPVVGIPASIDNDIYGTDMAIGVDTALNTIVDAIDKLRDTASSHTRAFLVETMGRASGYLAVQAGIVTGAEMVLVPEVPATVAEVAAHVEDAYRRGKAHCIIVVAEGFTPRTNDLADAINQLDHGFTTRVSILGHIQRGGSPTAFDRMLASRFGMKAVDFLIDGNLNMMTALRGREIVGVPIADVVSHTRQVSEEYLEMARVLSM
jgi:6-phosphofructokinase 1